MPLSNLNLIKKQGTSNIVLIFTGLPARAYKDIINRYHFRQARLRQVPSYNRASLIMVPFYQTGQRGCTCKTGYSGCVIQHVWCAVYILK